MTPEQELFLIWGVAAWTIIMLVLGLVAAVHAVCSGRGGEPEHRRYMDSDE